jgi:hypothetical protein
MKKIAWVERNRARTGNEMVQMDGWVGKKLQRYRTRQKIKNLPG